MSKVLAQLKLGTTVVREVLLTLKPTGSTKSEFCENVSFKAIWKEDLCNPVQRNPRVPGRIDAVCIEDQFYKVRKVSTTCNGCKQMFSLELSQSLFDNSVQFDLKVCRKPLECDWKLEHVDLGVPIVGGLSLDSRTLDGDTQKAHYVCRYRLQTDAFEKICEYPGDLLLCRKSDNQVFKIEDIKASDACPYLIISKTKEKYEGSEQEQYETFA